jgi:hypothetical protein
VKVGDFEISLRELGGFLGDLGTLLPLAVGYIVVCGVLDHRLFVERLK